jgi:hypothetical protein
MIVSGLDVKGSFVILVVSKEIFNADKNSSNPDISSISINFSKVDSLNSISEGKICEVLDNVSIHNNELINDKNISHQK